MTYQQDYTLPAALLERLTQDGLDALPDMVRVVINAAMLAERQKYLGVNPYQRGEQRNDQANGFKPKTVKTRVGEVTFEIPQVRQGDFYPQALEKGLRSERALNLALAEMYVQGVSTRKVAAIIEQLCGTSVSSSHVSRAAAQLDEVLHAWRTRALTMCRYVTNRATEVAEGWWRAGSGSTGTSAQRPRLRQRSGGAGHPSSHSRGSHGRNNAAARPARQHSCWCAVRRSWKQQIRSYWRGYVSRSRK